MKELAHNQSSYHLNKSSAVVDMQDTPKEEGVGVRLDPDGRWRRGRHCNFGRIAAPSMPRGKGYLMFQC